MLIASGSKSMKTSLKFAERCGSSLRSTNVIVNRQRAFKIVALVVINLSCYVCYASRNEPLANTGLNNDKLLIDNIDPLIDSGDAVNNKQPLVSMRNIDSIILDDQIAYEKSVNASNVFEFLLKKKPYSKFWTPEQKWDDLFKRAMAVQGTIKQMLTKNLLKDLESYADLSISQECANDIKYIQNYARRSTNFRWLMHMIDATGKNEPGMLTGNLANLGHVVQCIRVRAPAKPSNHTFEERFFDEQTELLGERFRGKYCLASLRPVLPDKPRLMSRFSGLLNTSLLSNISFTGEPINMLKKRAQQTEIYSEAHDSIDRLHYRLDQIPFESELYQYLIEQRNFMFTLPRFMGVCYPSSCTEDDIRMAIQKTVDDQHQVVDIEYRCEQEEYSAWTYYKTPRLICMVALFLVATLTFGASVARYILVDKLRIKRSKLDPASSMANILGVLELLALDKCVGILFVKTKPALTIVDETKVENNRSTSIDALKGFLVLCVVYSQVAYLGCLPVPFMWSKWSDAMFPFYRSLATQPVLNVPIWSEAFYIISAYLIAIKILENGRPSSNNGHTSTKPIVAPDFLHYTLQRYVRLVLPMAAFILLNYIWPRLSNGFVMQDQAEKIMAPCDNFGWTNLLMFHNNYGLNETCLWPSFVSASYFQLHILSYPIILMLLFSLKANMNTAGAHRMTKLSLAYTGFGLMALLACFGLVYSAYNASNQEIIAPFLIDYFDYDNYKRALEWLILPTHNHLASYMVGLVVAYMVVRKRVEQELRRASTSDYCSGLYMHREGSFESVRSSSTQELNTRHTPIRIESPSNLTYVSNIMETQINSYQSKNSIFSNLLMSILMLTILTVSISASWFWNGLGQPMTSSQTFWYLVTTKLCFNLSFAYLFYKHFATRRNASNPWVLTRFLVPIGRMSLMVFYMSWLVIWFDLLSSLFQWHPSHYFVAEKYQEIIFMTLVLSMFAYGAFEGTTKRLQHIRRQAVADKLASMTGFTNFIDSKGFASMFVPLDDTSVAGNEAAEQFDKMTKSALPNSKVSDNEMVSKSSPTALPAIGRNLSSPAEAKSHSIGKSMGGMKQQQQQQQQAVKRHNLSITEQYKLNAELRANYSFASIGLYETAGATGDLTTTNDPQVSPAFSHKQRM